MIEITGDPSGEAYDRLIALAEEHCGSFSLVFRDQLEFNRAALAFEELLAPYLIRTELTSEWPGTRLVGHEARVAHFRLTAESANLLRRAGSLYAWLAPDLPEDLAFYYSDGSLFLGSIAHESEGFLSAHSISLAELNAAVPGLWAISSSEGRD